ncbi:DUF1493 family protein [Chitinophaga sp. Cy-1792]|uniref:DUF1493 family protein n=1 Tax=Chitinophaga sp. Cy-1792 TaxID=2608339 RepID=UPI0014226201|nr:DUF1493 family protein [Chitinophaga sp. Cy-1792]NIG56491.1 DUF1493 family protein [Chitinophaga sp. Cy-1792]
MFDNSAILLNDLIDFLQLETKCDRVLIVETALIEDDLGITGDDGEELIVKFSQRYQVDISNFDITKYFYPEPLITLHQISILPLRVIDLLNAIQIGKLNDDKIGK